MKIIKNTKTEPTEITCPACESILSYTYADINRAENQDVFSLNRVVKRYLICPVCKNDIDLKIYYTVKGGKE